MKIRQILESVSAGGMGTSSVATAPAKAGKMQKRKGNLFAAEGAEFGAYYSEEVAQKIFDKRQDITSEDEVLNQAYHIVANEQGQKTARYKFNYDEDFPSDVVSSYFWLQRNKGVEEGSDEQVYKVVALDKSNALKKPTKLNVKASSIEDVFSRLAANDWYALSINGVEVVAGKRLKQGVAEGADFGAYYSEEVAQKIFDKRQDITSEDEVLNQAYHIVANEQGQKTARYKFNYDEDFPSDVVSNYFWLQKQQGVAEGAAETMPMRDAVAYLRKHGADNFKTTSNELHFYKNGRPFSVDLVWNDDTTRSVTISSLNAARRGLTGQGVAEAKMSPQQQHDFDRMRAGAMSRQSYDAKWKKPRKSDDEVIYSKKKGIAEGSMPPSPKPQWSKEQNAKRQHTQKELKRAQFLKKKAAQAPTQGMSNAEKADKGWRNPNVAESTPKDPNAPKKVQDRKTGKWYDPQKEFDKKMNSPEVRAQMKRMAQKESVAEGASDFIGNAIEDLRSSKPGLDIESFLDELYFYLDAEWGKQAADQVSNADDATHQEWYANYTDMMEVSLGNYRSKASMSRGKAQMSAMLGSSPEEKAKGLATFNKRDAGIARADVRIKKQRDAEQAKQTADLVARLPELKAEYEKMQQRYKALGGSNWQYADREQNLTSSEREARSMEGAMNHLWRQIQAAEKAQGQQGVAENKKGVRAVKHTVKPRNFVAKNAIQSGAGAHKDKKKAQKQGDTKHKGKELAYESKLWAALERKISK